MRTDKYHISTWGKFAPHVPVDQEGYVVYHVSPRYQQATTQQLEAWLTSRLAAVRAAAATELAQRKLSAWRRGSSQRTEAA